MYKVPNAGGVATFIQSTGGNQTWLMIQDYGGLGEGYYALTILEIEPMILEILANDILSALNLSGVAALCINFETGKSESPSIAKDH